MRQLRDAKIELFEEAFSVPAVPRCYKQNKSRVLSVMRQSPANKDVNMEFEEATAFGSRYQAPTGEDTAE
jgi:hypothetical protein